MHFSEAENPRNSQVSLVNRLNIATRYIGELNVQIREIKSVFSMWKKYPRSKKGFLKIMKFLSEKALGIVNVDWVIFRIVDSDNLRTLTETVEVRGGQMQVRHNISNTALWQYQSIDGVSVVGSGKQNISIETFCVLPTNEMKSNQRILIGSLVCLVEMIFVIYHPKYLIEH